MLTSTAFSITQWTYRNMFEARKACAEYYFNVYSNGKATGRNPDWIKDSDIQSFHVVIQQTETDMIKFSDILDTPYTEPTFDIRKPKTVDNSASETPVPPYSNGADIPYFGSDFQHSIPGYSVIRPIDMIHN